MIATVTADALLEFFVRKVFDQLRKNGTAIVHPGILAAPAPVSGSNRSRSSYQSTFVVAIRCGYVAKISPDSNDFVSKDDRKDYPSDVGTLPNRALTL